MGWTSDHFQDSLTLAETWNGTGWVITPSPNPGSPTYVLDVSCTSSTFCMAVGEAQVGGFATFVERWDGTAWTVVASPSPGINNVLNAVSCVSPTFCVAVGQYEIANSPPEPQQTLVEIWDGTGWSVRSSPSPTTSDLLSGVSCTSATFCIAVGRSTGGAVAFRTLVEAWNGTTWSVTPSPDVPDAPDYFSSVSCTSTTFCVAMGRANAALIETWNGSIWSIATGPSLDLVDGRGVSCWSSRSCVGVGRRIAVSSTGVHWSSTPIPAKGLLSGVSCVSATFCVTVGSVAYDEGVNGALAMTGPGAAPPDAPSSATAVSGSSTTATGSLTVRYAAPTSNGGDAIVSYTATCVSSNGGVTKTATHTGPNAVAIVVGGLATGKTYKCTVKASNHSGSGPASAATLAVIVGSPAPPTGVSAVRVVAGSLRVAFTPGANNGKTTTSYSTTCTSTNGGGSGSKTGSASPLTVTGLTHGKSYRCTVRGTNARGAGLASAPSATVTA